MMTRRSQLWMILSLLAAQAGCASSNDETPRTSAQTASRQTSAGGEATPAETSRSAPLDEASAASVPTPSVAQPASATQTTSAQPVPPESASRQVLTDAAREAFRRGIESARQGQLDAARTSFEQALASDARAHQAAYNAGVIAER